ncbi:3-methyl-2-oxobutanoate hydroxymethyltransferase [Falsiruegeria litorea R37]|uniref:3-methyl-2-oxobutanoate hydroxymethyltransferase n=1 Tax=Falsiruegeria litorea R37 TaxID=1200284 RepID=A0A1Y5TR93_9RHOB|nr:3-methyl-2-oxobutanoate hydroxymethyltransferase [Falsiruegeria litorea]SLN70177.1 3-methyl-2-oxobutanoate hydroxymethyltransferase [Falsiruegeria litorea R37]
MKNIYTYGGQPARRNLTIDCLRRNKVAGVKMTQVSAINGDEARACEEMGIDMITISDLDYDAVRAGAPHTFITSSQTMCQYFEPQECLTAAMKAAEKGADAIFTPRGMGIVELIANEGLAVQGHVGLVPRKSTLTGGLKTFGKTAEEAMKLLDWMRRYEDAGAAAVEVECVAVEALQAINHKTSLLTHSIGAGSGGDIIFSFMEDICGDVENPPRHAKAWGDVRSIRKQLTAERDKSLTGFRTDVQSGAFPDAEHTVGMLPGEQEKLHEALAKWQPLHQ